MARAIKPGSLRFGLLVAKEEVRGAASGMSAIREIGGVARISAFVSGVLEGNPAGVWLGDGYREAELMQAVAAEVGLTVPATQKGLKRALRRLLE